MLIVGAAPSWIGGDAQQRWRDVARAGTVFYGWVVVAAAALSLFLSFGALYAFASFFRPLSEAFGANRAGLSGLFGVTLALANLLGVATGRLADRTGARPLVLLGGLLAGGGLLLASRADSLWRLYVTYALGLGLGIGFVMAPATETVQHWFVRRRGFASGLAVAGIGAGNLAFPPLTAALLRGMDWRDLFVLLGIVSAVGVALASRLFVDRPADRGLTPDGDPALQPATTSTESGLRPGEALREGRFWLLYAAMTLAGLGSFVPFVHLAPDAESHGISAVAAATLLGMIGGGSLAGRFVVGGAADRFGRRRSLLAAFGVAAAFLAWWLLATELWSLAIFAAGFGLAYGSLSALYPALGADYFGTKHAGAIIGILYTALVPGSLLGPTLAGYAYDLYDSYTLPIAASVTTMVAAAICTLFLPDPQPGRAPVSTSGVAGGTPRAGASGR